ncbi:MAG: ferredoxin, partial [Burkholderiaceae bacterium]
MIAWLKDLMVSNAVPGSPARTAATPPPVRVRAEPGETLAIQLALVIDLNVCVGCHACVTSCKEWNTSGSAGPLAD